jgi:hypothetical protein
MIIWTTHDIIVIEDLVDTLWKLDLAKTTFPDDYWIHRFSSIMEDT